MMELACPTCKFVGGMMEHEHGMLHTGPPVVIDDDDVLSEVGAASGSGNSLAPAAPELAETVVDHPDGDGAAEGEVAGDGVGGAEPSGEQGEAISAAAGQASVTKKKKAAARASAKGSGEGPPGPPVAKSKASGKAKAKAIAVAAASAASGEDGELAAAPKGKAKAKAKSEANAKASGTASVAKSKAKGKAKASAIAPGAVDGHDGVTPVAKCKAKAKAVAQAVASGTDGANDPAEPENDVEQAVLVPEGALVTATTSTTPHLFSPAAWSSQVQCCNCGQMADFRSCRLVAKLHQKWRCGKCGVTTTQLRRHFGCWPSPSFSLLSEDGTINALHKQRRSRKQCDF